MKKIFYQFSNLTHRKINFGVHTRNTQTFWNKSLVHHRYTYGIHCLKRLGKNLLDELDILIQRLFEKVFSSPFKCNTYSYFET